MTGKRNNDTPSQSQSERKELFWFFRKTHSVILLNPKNFYAVAGNEGSYERSSQGCDSRGAD
jgi:hypothetical protein